MGFTFSMGKAKEAETDVISKGLILDETRMREFEYFSYNEAAKETKISRPARNIIGMRIVGKLNYDLDVANGKGVDPQKDIVDWAMTESDAQGAYRHVIVTAIDSDQVTRQYSLPAAYVVSYEESQDEAKGVGLFELVIRQKLDEIGEVKIEAGFTNPVGK